MRLALLITLATAATANADPMLSAPEVDFGEVAYGTTSLPHYLTLANVGDGTLEISEIVIDGPGFAFDSPVCGPSSGQTCVPSPPLEITTTAALIAIQCAGVEPGTTQVATVTFNAGGIQTQAVLTCAVAPGPGNVFISPSVLNFGNVDIRGKPPTLVEHVLNQSAADVSITSIQVTTSTAFVALATPGTVPANSSFDIPVTYTPTAEGVPDSGELVVELGSDGFVEAQLLGTGIDRHAVLESVPTFPDTFLEPGYAATQEPIVIGNTGGAVLGLSNATITGAPVWSLADPGPVDLPGAGTDGPSTYGFEVRFAPTAAGAAPPATFTVDTTDPAVPTITATVGGTGVPRLATMAPADVELDYAGVGTTVHGSDPSRDVAITVTNTDPAATYTITAIRAFGGDGAFEVLDAYGPLAPGASRSFDVAFTPPHEGELTATAQLFLDFDPAPAAEITLHGTGTFVAVAGGGGCAAAGGDAGAIAIVLVVAALIRTRRRAAIGLVAAGIGGAGIGAASAQTRDLDLALFDPTPSTTAPMFALQTPDVGAEGAWAATALVTYADQPLVLGTATNDDATIQNRATLELGGAFAFGERFEAGLHVPLILQSGQDLSSATMYGEPAVSGTALGDLELDAKARLSRAHGPAGELVTGVAIGLQLPTANDQQFAGSSQPQLRALALVRYTPAVADDRIALDANAGGVVRGAARYDDIDQQSGIDWGAGVRVRARRDLAVALELFGELVPGGVVEPMGTTRVLDTAEALVGVHYQIDRHFTLGVAVGRGLTDEFGSPAFRGVVGLTFGPGTRGYGDARPAAGDADHDGVPDDVDRCPNEPEDVDGFEDADGCPDPDNDHDGIPDAEDKCPNEPEDRDGFQDADGCPDPDNDRDGIPDRIDRCPDQPETINGFQDEDGCPDQGAGLVTIARDHLGLGEPVAFAANGKLDPASFNELGQVGATLRAHLELATIRIVARTLAHATAIRDWLVQYGIASSRLEAADDATAGADEIDLLVVERL